MQDSLDQFKKIACMSCQSLSSRARELIMESKLKKKEIVKVGGMCVAIKGRKSIAFKLERKSIKDSTSGASANFWLLIKGIFAKRNWRLQPQEGKKRGEKPKGIEAELYAWINLPDWFYQFSYSQFNYVR